MAGIAISLALIYLIFPVAAVRAQNPPPANRIERAIALEAGRLAAIAQQPDDNDDWSRVKELAPGSEIVFTARGRATSSSLFVAADDASITVMTLERVSLRADEKRALIALIGRHPDAFSTTPSASVRNRDVRVEAGAVFANGRRIGGVGELIGRYVRGDVVDLGVMTPSHPIRNGALIGLGAGAAIGLAQITSNCAGRGEGVCAVPLLWSGMFAGIGAGSGAAIGALLSSSADRRPMLMYRAP